jgi:hypothetical protein
MKRCLSCHVCYASSLRNCAECGLGPAVLNGIDAYAPVFAYEGGGFKEQHFSELARLEEASFWFRI